MKPGNKTKLLSASVLLALASLASPASAEEEALPEYTFLDAIKGGKNLTSFRLRYENVDQDGNGAAPKNTRPLKEADGITLRSLIGWQTAPFKNLSFAIQLTDVSKFQDDYNDRDKNVNQKGHEQYPFIVDPDDTDINQLFVEWTGIKNNKVRLGRQSVKLDNVRFIGNIEFRQVTQVFDGIALENKSIPETEIYLAHFDRVKQITTKLRDDGYLNIANIKYRISPSESLVGYGYFSNFEDLGFGNNWFGAGKLNASPGVNNATADQSNKTLGLRLDGVHKLNDDWKAIYTAEYAKQTDFNDGDDRIDAHYYRLGGGAAYGNFSLRVDQEMLSSNDGKYAFQTPFGTNHLFQGWVDKFLTTPKEGIKDTFLTAAYKIGDFAFLAEYHLFDSDKDFNKVGGGFGDRYGKEWDASVAYTFNKNISAKVEYGKYTEDDHYAATPTNTVQTGRIRDTDKLWLTAMYTF